MKKKKTRNLGEIDYWQPTSDLLIGLLLILLLVIAMLGLYVLHIPDIIMGDLWPGDSNEEFLEEGNSYETGDDEYDSRAMQDNASPYPSPTVTPTPTPTVTPNDQTGTGPGDGEDTGDEPDEGIKSAVYVMLVDAETGRTVKEAGVVFELYSVDNGLQILNTYYPQRISFREYETTEAGTFYLPEKIYEGEYWLHELTEASGYDISDNQEFVIDELYDWPEPYTVRVPVYPSRNIIRIRVVDSDTGLPVPGGTFDVVAAEDILTLDGTIRYQSGQTVDEIVCDEDGYGESTELYIGSYTVRQKEIPEYYASVLTPVSASVEKSAEVDPRINTIETEKTTLTLRLTDELYNDRPIEGAEFEIQRGANEPEIFTTDGAGRIELTDLEKGVTYRLIQTGAVGDYHPDTEEHTLTIGSNGRVNLNAHPSIELTNRMIRVTVSIQDALLGTQIDGENVALYDSSDEVVHTWTSTGVATTFTDLSAGSYYVVRNGDLSHRYILFIENTAEPQALNVTLFTLRSAGAAALAGVVGLGLIIGMVVVLRKSAKKRKERKAAKTAAAVPPEKENES